MLGFVAYDSPRVYSRILRYSEINSSNRYFVRVSRERNLSLEKSSSQAPAARSTRRRMDGIQFNPLALSSPAS